MSTKTLTLKTRQVQQLATEIGIFSGNGELDMFTRHCLKRIQATIKPIVDDFESSYKELVLKYADEDKDYISPNLPLAEDAAEGTQPEVNPKYKLFLEEIELIAGREEDIEIKTLSSEILKKYSIDSYQENFHKTFTINGLIDFDLFYELFD